MNRYGAKFIVAYALGLLTYALMLEIGWAGGLNDFGKWTGSGIVWLLDWSSAPRADGITLFAHAYFIDSGLGIVMAIASLAVVWLAVMDAATSIHLFGPRNRDWHIVYALKAIVLGAVNTFMLAAMLIVIWLFPVLPIGFSAYYTAEASVIGVARMLPFAHADRYMVTHLAMPNVLLFLLLALGYFSLINREWWLEK